MKLFSSNTKETKAAGVALPDDTGLTEDLYFLLQDLELAVSKLADEPNPWVEDVGVQDSQVAFKNLEAIKGLAKSVVSKAEKAQKEIKALERVMK